MHRFGQTRCPRQRARALSESFRARRPGRISCAWTLSPEHREQERKQVGERDREYDTERHRQDDSPDHVRAVAGRDDTQRARGEQEEPAESPRGDDGGDAAGDGAARRTAQPIDDVNRHDPPDRVRHPEGGPEGCRPPERVGRVPLVDFPGHEDASSSADCPAGGREEKRTEELPDGRLRQGRELLHGRDWPGAGVNVPNDGGDAIGELRTPPSGAAVATATAWRDRGAGSTPDDPGVEFRRRRHAAVRVDAAPD